MRTEVVHYDDIARLQLRAEHAFQIREEDVGIGGRFDGHGGKHPVEIDRAEDGQDFPVPPGRGFGNAPSSPRTAIEAGHAGGDSAFIQEDQLFRRDRLDAFKEVDPPLEVDRGVSLKRVKRLFFMGSFSRASVSQTSERLSRSPD